MPEHKDHQVSFDSEMLILVDREDQETGYLDKRSCHIGQGVLHRAFSIFIFNEQRQVLMQKRSDQKHLWPLFWSNSCCSHPRRGEKMEYATQRRLEEELGFSAPLQYLFKFIYQAPYRTVGSEHELCHVYIGKSEGPVNTNRNEIAEWRFFDIAELERAAKMNPDHFTPWFKMEWEILKTKHWPAIEALGHS